MVSARWSRLPSGPWIEQLPDITDPERQAFVAQIADMMDARKVRIGEHAADNALPWLCTHWARCPMTRWTGSSGSSGPALSALSGTVRPRASHRPNGPEPTAGDLDKRAAWHEAFAALGPVDGPDVRGMPDGTLLHLRDTYPIETAWAPQWVGDELRQVRLGAQEARLAAIRAEAEAKASADRGDEDAAARQHDGGRTTDAAGVHVITATRPVRSPGTRWGIPFDVNVSSLSLGRLSGQRYPASTLPTTPPSGHCSPQPR